MKLEGLPQSLRRPTGNGTCVVFCVWNTKSDKDCLLSSANPWL